MVDQMTHRYEEGDDHEGLPASYVHGEDHKDTKQLHKADRDEAVEGRSGMSGNDLCAFGIGNGKCQNIFPAFGIGNGKEKFNSDLLGLGMKT